MARPRKDAKDVRVTPTPATSESHAEQALKVAFANIEKRYGSGAVFLLDASTHVNIDSISTGSLTVDIATGIGGIPRGRITEVFGPESSGKTTLCLHIVAEAQKAGGLAAFIDMEHALDPNWSRRLGVNTGKLVISQPESGEQALQIAEELITSGAISVLVIDSVAALVPRAEIEGDMGDSHVGLQARLMSQALRKLNSVIKATNTAVVFTNQIREKVGIMYGSPETQPGGRALKFYASMRFDVRKLESVKDKDVVAGSHVRVKVVKNKVAPPFREAEFDIMFQEGGISKSGEIIDLGSEIGVIEKRGAFYRYNDELVGQGREAAKRALNDNPELMAEIENKIRIAYGITTTETTVDLPASLPYNNSVASDYDESDLVEDYLEDGDSVDE